MAKARTDPEVEARILELRAEGRSYTYIEEQTGVSKSTVRDVVKRAECGLDSAQKIPARAREGKIGQTDDVPVRNESAPQSAHPSDKTDYVSMLTRDRTAKELMTYIGLAKKGYDQARKEKEALKADKDKEHKEGQEKTWQEIQYLKLYKDGIKILVDCTGLSREAILAEPSNPVDDYLEKTLAELRDEL